MMHRYLSRFWDRLNLMTRLLLVVVVGMTLALLGAAYQTAHDTAADVQLDLTAEFQKEMETLAFMAAPALIADTADADPDPVRLKAVLEGVHRGPEVVHIGFRDTSDAVSYSRDIPLPLQAPLWFSRWCGLEEIGANRAVVIEGRYYGVLTLTLSPNDAINQAWARYVKQIMILSLCFLWVWFSMWWVLRRGLLPLQALAAANEALGRGDLSTRLAVRGSPELRTSLSNFNRMALRIEAARNDLSASEERHRTLLQTAMDGFWMVDTQEEGRLIEVNETYCRMSGYTAEELLTLRIRDIEAVQTADDIAERIGKIITKGEDRFETRHRRKDGSLFDIEVSVQYRPMEGGRFVVFMRDITERKRMERDREKLQAQLTQAQKMESVGALAGGVAHDYNNMIGVILGYADLALEKVASNESLYDDLQEIRNAAVRSMEVTRQLLAFARKQTIAPIPIDLNETVEGMLKMLRRLIGEDIDLSWLPESDLWPVKMDPSQIDQMLANLCINARDAIAGVGKITIETGMTSFDEAYCAGNAGFVPGEFVLLSLSDNGCGMDRETVARIFEPFFTTKDVGHGTGLGLATVYGIVKQNNGFINVYSEPGQGTTFKIYLPRHKDITGQMQRKEPTELAIMGWGTVLLVEDEPSILKMTATILEHLGYTVLAAATPGKAVFLAQTHPGEIHLLMTDVVMPEMNGRDLSERIRTLRPAIRCLFMSGYTADVIAHRGVLDKGVQFIQKPFSKKDLAEKIHKALEGVN
ncbi:MAG: PAS domain S-box protein [Pseudomonadota bacterium]